LDSASIFSSDYNVVDLTFGHPAEVARYVVQFSLRKNTPTYRLPALTEIKGEMSWTCRSRFLYLPRADTVRGHQRGAAPTVLDRRVDGHSITVPGAVNRKRPEAVFLNPWDVVFGMDSQNSWFWNRRRSRISKD
jgi:hypothetical protein